MPHISSIVNGNGQITIEPSTNVNTGDVVTIRAYPYEGEIVDTITFEENINGVWNWIGVSEVSHNVWRFRIDQYDVRVNILFTSRYEPPPEPPEPPEPEPVVISPWLIAVISKLRRL